MTELNGPPRPGDDKDNLDAVYDQLLEALVQGHMSEAETLAARVLELVKEREGSLAGPQKESIQQVIEGIGAILSGDNSAGIEQLSRVTTADDTHRAMRLAAWLWITWATRDAGDIDAATRAARTLARLSHDTTPKARSVSLRAVAEVEAVAGDLDSALERLNKAAGILEDLGDPHGLARATLARARILAGRGQDRDANSAAHLAAGLDPKWVEPHLFLAKLGFKEGAVGTVETHLSQLDRIGPRTPEAGRLAKLADRVRAAELPLWGVAEYLRLRDAVPGQDTVGELRALLLYLPQFLELQEELGWKLTKLGRHDEAREQFHSLLEREDVAPEILTSVRLGLGMLASLKDRHLPPSARVRAAVTAVPGPAKPAVLTEPPSAPRRRMRTISRAASLQRELEEVAGKRAVFSGDLQILQIPDLLEFLKNSKRTGTLVVNSRRGVGAIYVRGGMITCAASPTCDNIGDLLLARGQISEGQLEQAASTQQEDDHHTLLGAIIVEQGIADAETVRQALTDQVYSAVRELFTWNEGQFAFSPEAKGLPSTIDVELDPQHVLLDVVRQLDEESAQ